MPVMMKVTGAACIFAACAGMGFGKGMEYKKRIEELLLLKKWMLMLRGEIRYAQSPLPEAFSRIGERIGHVYGMFLGRLASSLESQSGQSFQELWERELDEVMSQQRHYLSREDIRQLKALGGQLGYLDREMQMSSIDFFVEQLETQIDRLEQEKARRCRVYHCLGIFTGVMLNLILL